MAPEAVIGMNLMQEEFLDQSLLLAANVQNNFREDLKRKDRGVKQAGFVVLHQTYMPSVLIETGFISNQNEGAFLNSKQGQDKVATAIYEAIKGYKKNMDENVVVEEVAKPIEKPASKVYEGVDFRVQIASGAKKLALESYNFKGLKGVERQKVGSHYKYYYGKTSDYNDIVKIQKEARKAGFTSAFVIAFKEGERVLVSEVIK